MRRIAVTLLSAVLLTGLPVGLAHGAKAKKVGTQVEIEWYEGGGPITLFGDVHSKKNKCERKREVTLYREVGGNLEKVATDTTDRTGDWAIPAEFAFDMPFVASVEKRKLGSGDKKLVCKPADSAEFVIEP